MPLDFLAIDFETANEQRGSVCSVGVTQVRDGAITGSGHWFVNPPTGDRFTNTHIHGIELSQVHNAPTWAQSIDTIEQWAEGHPLVAHNSPFDRGVYNAASQLAHIQAPQYQWRDTVTLAKSHLDLSNYRLTTVAEHLGLPAFSHHHAAADSIACAQIALTLAQRAGLTGFDDLWPRAVRQGSSGRATWYSTEKSAPLPRANPNADPDHILYGVSITFTGDLEAFTRVDARSAAADLGAHVTGGPTKKTEIVVVGSFDPSTLRPGMATSSKVQRALDLRDAGQALEIISESDFIALLNYDPSIDEYKS